jgi:hypothetical protein
MILQGVRHFFPGFFSIQYQPSATLALEKAPLLFNGPNDFKNDGPFCFPIGGMCVARNIATNQICTFLCKTRVEMHICGEEGNNKCE